MEQISAWLHRSLAGPPPPPQFGAPLQGLRFQTKPSSPSTQSPRRITSARILAQQKLTPPLLTPLRHGGPFTIRQMYQYTSRAYADRHCRVFAALEGTHSITGFNSVFAPP